MPVSCITAPVFADIPGLVHGFTTREGGESAGAFASLNLGYQAGDEADRVDANYARVADALGIATEAIASVRQVHGKDCVLVAPETDLDELRVAPADAMVTRERGIFLSVRTADCYPVLVVDPRQRWVAAVHAGWRGTLAGALSGTIATLKDKLGADPRDLRVAIGPGIGFRNFEVSTGVAALFRASPGFQADEMREGEASAHLDLAAINARQAREAGVPAGQIWKSDACTFADARRFYSYRRDGKNSGRMAAIVGWKA